MRLERISGICFSIFKEDVLHVNVTNRCCDGDAVGLAVVLIAFHLHSGKLTWLAGKWTWTEDVCISY